ncbi:NEL-type E3 ubiquitin ligase domain-containing protein [Pseudomonas sp. Pseusp122]|uniref:NEL-type E3 ubiquitin ligase domain-containing protein n=1 Tax=unclassified Pseudomonas TaxID=196821 RepID=UPI0039A5A976
MPDVVQQLQRAHAAYLVDERPVKQLLARLPSVEVFAAPLLTAAIEERFGLKVDVRTSYLFYARRFLTDQSFGAASKDPLVATQDGLKAATQPLLRAALQNFEAFETQPGAMDKSSRNKAAIYADYPVKGIAVTGTVLPIAPEQFADLCRTLDLGGKYQALISAVVNPVSRPGDAPGAAAAIVQAQFKRFEASAMTLQVHIARMKGLINADQHSALLESLRHRSGIYLNGQQRVCSFLTLWDIPLTGIVAIGKPANESNQIEKIIVYIPDDPFHPLKEYESTLHFINELRDRLLHRSYMDFFMRFVPARERNRLARKLHEAFYPKVWNKAGWYEQVLDKNAKLHLRAEAFPSGQLIADIHRQKVAMLHNDGLFHAVPTAAEDHKTLEDKLRYFAEKTFEVLNIAAFVVPVLGEIMLAVTAAQLCYEVYEGIESLTRDEKEQAWSYLLDVVENLALMAALGTASANSPGIAAVKAPAVIEQMHVVELPTGSTRLWKPDLAPFAHDIVLPAGLEPNALGLYDYQGQQWLALEGRTYAVKGATPYRLQHPTRPDAYQPTLRHNHAGAWLHELEQPLDWQGLTLFRRLGRAHAGFTDVTARRILQVSDTHEAVLRHTLAEGERPPAMLDDTVQRFRLDQELASQIANDEHLRPRRHELFEARYEALQTSDNAGVALMLRDYSGLPKAVAQELLRHASAEELLQLTQEQRLPLRIAEEIRAYQQQVRLTRAYEGLYLDSVDHPDTDVLILHTLETLPGWSPHIRLEVRDGSFHGALLDSIGPIDAPIRKVLIKEGRAYEARDSNDQHLHGRDNVFAAVMHALPDAQRQALGLPHVGQGSELQQALQARPLLPRQALAGLLKMQPRKPGFKSPMRLADGRLGYLLSGRGAMEGHITRETLLDKVRLLELPEPAEHTLAALENARLSRVAINQRLDQLLSEQQALRARLNNWTQTPTASPEEQAAQTLSRQRIHDELWNHWQTSHLPEIGRHAARLRLEAVCLSDFPAQLPDFIFERIHTLELNDVTVDIHRTLNTNNALADLFSRLPHLTSLTIGRSALSAGFRELELLDDGRVRELRPGFGFPHLLAGSLDGLRELRLTNLGLYLSSIDIDSFRQMSNLQILDLTGNRMLTSASALSPQASLPDFGGLNLQYLGLEGMELDRWPAWINSRWTGQIAEISLVDNRITSLPDDVLYSPAPAEQQTRVLLRGNALPRRVLIAARLANDRPHGRFSFEVETPLSLETTVEQRLHQQRALHEAVDNWAEASSSAAPLSEERIRARRQIGENLGAFWRDISTDHGPIALELNAIDLDDFPRQLPEFFYRGVQHLLLSSIRTAPGQLDGLLRHFTQLRDLTIRDHMTAMVQLPAVLSELSSLATLSLLNQGLLIDQTAIEFFARLPALTHLSLDGNTLGEIIDISPLAGRRLSALSLSNVGLQAWPEWLSELIPGNMDMLHLDDNQLTELPEHVLQNRRNNEQHTEISLLGNPLTHDTMRRAHTSEGNGRTYSFAMDLPADILLLDYETHSSDTDTYDSDSSDSYHHIHSPPPHPVQEVANIEPWLYGAVEEQQHYRAIWQQLDGGQDAQDLLNLINRLRHTADYRTLRNRPEIIARVWRVLEAAAQDAELRLTLNGMAEEPLRLLLDYDTCPDGIRLEFNQMEVLIYTRQALLDAPVEHRGQALYHLTRRLYRLHELDRIAREQAGSRDEAEVRLAYRLQWAAELELPLPPGSMLYRAHARLRPGELDEALGRVRQGESTEPFMAYAAQRDFWMDYLRETYAERFRQLKDAYEANVLALTDLHPDDNVDQYAPRIAALEQQFKEDEQYLIRQLTIQEGMSQD